MTTLLVASAGGHLAELHNLVPRLGIDERRWVTFDSPQSRWLLEGEDVVYVPPAASRDLGGAVRDLFAARRMFRRDRYDKVISTGASVALSFFTPATAAGIECAYIESATRTCGPSLTGRLVAKLPRVRLYTQHPSWSDRTWTYGGSVFDAYTAHRRPASRPVRKVVVTLGTHPRFTFPRLLSRLVDILPDSVETLWQVGATTIAKMPPGARRNVPIPEMRQAVHEADVVVTHAGVGSALTAMEAGRCALYVPRRHAYGEHVDDHQVQIARELSTRNLVVTREADDVCFADLEEAAAWSIRVGATVAPFRMTPPNNLELEGT